MEAPSRKEEEAREETASAEYPSSNCVDDHSTLCSKLSGECSSINSMTLWLHEQLQIDKEKSPQDIALHLWAIRDASNIGCISYFLGQKTLLSNLVFTNYLAFLDFTGLSLDRALRVFCESFYLSGESQFVEHVLEAFANHYHATNPKSFASSDIVYILANGLVILNTDLYNASNKKKMSKSTFVDVVQAALGSFSSMVDVEYLKVLYGSIKKKPILIPFKQGHEFFRSSASLRPSSFFSSLSGTSGSRRTLSFGTSHSLTNEFSSFSTLQTVSSTGRPWSSRAGLQSVSSASAFNAVHGNSEDHHALSGSNLPNGSTDGEQSEGLSSSDSLLKHHSFFVSRKKVYIAKNKKSKNRSWQHYLAVLDGSTLFFYPSFFRVHEHLNKVVKPFDTLILRHGFAKSYVHPRKSNLILFQNSQGLQQLFQCSSKEDSLRLISKINNHAARESAPPLPLPTVHNQESIFIPPTMPSYISGHPSDAQLEFILKKIEELQQLIKASISIFNASKEEEHVNRGNNAADATFEATRASKRTFDARMDYFNWELQKYQIYAAALNNSSHYLTLPTVRK